MNKYVFFLMALIFGAAFALDVEAQVEITYEKLPSQNSDSELHPGSFADGKDGKISEKIAVSVADADSVSSGNVLRYAWIDLGFLTGCNSQMSEKMTNLENRYKQINQLMSNSSNDTELAKYNQELSAVIGEINNFNSNEVWNYCIGPSIELGYIPIGTHRIDYSKDNAIGDKLRNAPDITGQVCNLMRKKPLRPYTSDKIGKSDQKIAYIDYGLFFKDCRSLVMSFLEIIDRDYSHKYGCGSDALPLLNKCAEENQEIVINSIKSKYLSWGYDGIIFVFPKDVPAVILEGMDDVTYIAKQQCLPREIIEDLNKKLEKVCYDYYQTHIY